MKKSSFAEKLLLFMEFLKIKDYWTYQLPEWDNYYKEDIEDILNSMYSITILDYVMEGDVDVWTIRYKDCDFILVNDLVYGCEIRAPKEEDLPQMEQLIKSLDI